MKVNGLGFQAHCEDENGQTLLVTLERAGGQGNLMLKLTQFHGMKIAWRGEFSIEELCDSVKRAEASEEVT